MIAICRHVKSNAQKKDSRAKRRKKIVVILLFHSAASDECAARCHRGAKEINVQQRHGFAHHLVEEEKTSQFSHSCAGSLSKSFQKPATPEEERKEKWRLKKVCKRMSKAATISEVS